MADSGLHSRLTGLRDGRGDDSRDLRIGDRTIRFDGLDAPLARELEARWGPFLAPAGAVAADVTIRVLDAGSAGWLDAPFYGERYRLEAHGDPVRRIVVSYNFALGRASRDKDAWLLGITDRAREPLGRVVENAARYLLAILALDRGGFAMHAAGVLHEGRAWIYAGPSRSGKSTAVAASLPAIGLGDDYALVVRDAGGWFAPAVPFDSSETVGSDAPRGLFPVAGIWRLHKSEQTAVERPSPHVAPASLLSCAAFPWTYAERADALLDHVRRFVDERRFGHLHFGLRSDLYGEFLTREAGVD